MAMTKADFPHDEPEFRGAWSQCAGRRAALGEVVGTVNQRAAQAFLADNPAVAQELRSLAKEFEKREREASEDLQEYIAESQRRSAARKG
jgi:hypothetical protein